MFISSEKENIWTFDSKGELLITIMSSLAQEESRSISENCTWGQRKRFSDGKVTVPFGRFLGYDRGEDGNLVVEEQAQIVRRIYGLFLQGRSPYTIAKMLTAESIPTPGGKKAWGTAVIKSILTNEKYKGDALLQKVYTTDFLSKKKKKNEGEIPQYYVEGNHEAIISPDVFDRVQLLMQANQTGERCKSYSNIFSGKIRCGDCGGWYGSKVWHSNDKYRKVIWQCNHKYSGGEKCTTPHLDEETIKAKFVEAVNLFCNERKQIISTFESIQNTAFQTTELEEQQHGLQEELNVIAELVQQCVEENAHTVQDQEQYQIRYGHLVERFHVTKGQLDEVSEKIVQRKAQREMMGNLVREVRKLPDVLDCFDESVWYALAEYVTVYSKEDIRFTFRDGTGIDA